MTTRGRDLEERGCKVVIVGFGKEANARDWKERNKCPYQVVVDTEAKIYRELGIQRSVTGVWGIPILIDFGERHLAKNLSYVHYEGDDLELLGGYFIADSSGKLVWAHVMTDVNDRPSLDTIVAVLDSANK